MKKSKKLRLAVIGCGGMAHFHAGTLLDDKRVKITKLVDVAPDHILAFKKHLPALADASEHEDYREVLDDVDGVVIVTPHTLHYQQVMDALDHGLHVFCEKPIVCTAARAKRVVEKVKKTRLKLQVGYGRRADPRMHYVRDQIGPRGIGKLRYVSVVLCQDWLVSQKGTWRQNPKLSGGGQLNDSGSHMVDMMLWLSKQRPTCVTAFLDNRGAKVDIDSAVNIQFDGGAIGSICLIATAHRWIEKWVFVGTKATLLFDNGLWWIAPGKDPVEVAPPKKHLSNITINWVDAIFGKAKLLSPAEDGQAVITLTEAMWRSAAGGGKPVRIK